LEQLRRRVGELKEQEKKRLLAALASCSRLWTPNSYRLRTSRYCRMMIFVSSSAIFHQLQNTLQDEENVVYDFQLKMDSYAACCYT
ncbi:hypothetical protein JG688_00014866, partial [Phytophthora aleatoria]